MEILQFLTSLFTNEQNSKFLMPIFELLKQNSFDLRKVLSNLDPQSLAPIIKEFMANMNNRPTDNVGRNNGLVPISNIADKDIIFSLNKYLGQEVT
ncbi:MAG: hypothetical protein J6V71_00855 [Clostridia bacterium]|nr:hypothetical protein [Clostridia bacterium]